MRGKISTTPEHGIELGDKLLACRRVFLALRASHTIVGGIVSHEETPRVRGDVELHHGVIEDAPNCFIPAAKGSITEPSTCEMNTLAFHTPYSMVGLGWVGGRGSRWTIPVW